MKRLINLGLVSEKVNKNDKRQKLISLTKKGKELLFKVYVGFSKIQDVMVGLNIEQRELLIHTLQSLDTFHTGNIQSLSNNSKK
ncbi:MarR family winged helix-turn-helix transcriptional regulator [Lunatibacter salilacus]|uniref:MarR family winged helix-turn-helix transcriptional regulator n=1 Tax=Lunatibacter salilacus TaxID=2483804 RepID=UPI0021D0FBB8|nr:winged helix DNA-binding protein [Lunatibacter salilacus]